MPLPDKEVFDSAEHLFNELKRVRALLSDPDIASIRIVLNPEKMVIKEAQRTLTYLNLYGYFTDLVICNRLIPEKVEDSYFHLWKKNQSRYYQLIEECFAPLPILAVPLLDQEVVGPAMLQLLASAVYGDEDPTKFFFHGQAQDIQMEDHHYVLTLSLPFIQKDEVSLMRSGDELIIRVGNFRRNIILPYSLVGVPVKGAKFVENKLRIEFEEGGGEKSSKLHSRRR